MSSPYWIRRCSSILSVLATPCPDWLTSSQSDSVYSKNEKPVSAISGIVYVVASQHQEIGHYSDVIWSLMCLILSLDCLFKTYRDWKQRNRQSAASLLTLCVGNPQMVLRFHGFQRSVMRKVCPWHVITERWRHRGTETEARFVLPCLNHLNFIIQSYKNPNEFISWRKAYSFIAGH